MTGRGKVVGYARVSSADQNLDRQIAALGEVDELFTEKVSGKDRRGRPQLEAMMRFVRADDVVRVKSMDRLGRSVDDLRAILRELEAKNVAVEFVDQPALNTSSPMGRFVLNLLAAVAEMERDLIRERQAEGIELAKKNGVYDRAPKLTFEQIEAARVRVADGVTKAQIAREYGVSRTTLHNALIGKGIYADIA